MTDIIRFAFVPQGFIQELFSECPPDLFSRGALKWMEEPYPDDNGFEDFEPIVFEKLSAGANIDLSGCRRFMMDIGPDPYGYFHVPGGWIGTNELTRRWRAGFAPFRGHWVPIAIVRQGLGST